MAIYHLSVKRISRSQGRSATAAAAYRGGIQIACEREGRVHDYTRRRGVDHTEIIVPTAASWARDPAALWNAAEAAERRKDAIVAREYELALPDELDASERIALTREFGEWICARYGVAAHVAIHAPSREGDQRNWHAHVLTTSRVAGADGLGAKTRILDATDTGPAEIVAIRAEWARMTNDALRRANSAERVSHLSLKDERDRLRETAAELESAGDPQAEGWKVYASSFDRPPETHVGPTATSMERKARREAAEAGEAYEPVTDRGRRRQQVVEWVAALKAAWLQFQRAFADHMGELRAAIERAQREREKQMAEAEARRVEEGRSALRQKQRTAYDRLVVAEGQMARAKAAMDAFEAGEGARKKQAEQDLREANSRYQGEAARAELKRDQHEVVRIREAAAADEARVAAEAVEAELDAASKGPFAVIRGSERKRLQERAAVLRQDEGSSLARAADAGREWDKFEAARLKALGAIRTGPELRFSISMLRDYRPPGAQEMSDLEAAQVELKLAQGAFEKLKGQREEFEREDATKEATRLEEARLEAERQAKLEAERRQQDGDEPTPPPTHWRGPGSGGPGS